jgi:hypothetical protein
MEHKGGSSAGWRGWEGGLEMCVWDFSRADMLSAVDWQGRLTWGW